LAGFPLLDVARHHDPSATHDVLRARAAVGDVVALRPYDAGAVTRTVS
jgi:hypothetical protein